MMQDNISVTNAKIDTFICVHRRDVDYLLELVLRSYQVNFLPKGTLTLITNDLPYLTEFIDRAALDIEVRLFNDNDWLSKQEMELPGWYRQQVIKLRAHQFCSTPNFCNLGADTLLLQHVDQNDLLAGDKPLLYFTHHRLPNIHLLYEYRRMQHVARILKVKPAAARKYIDFINDFFCFNREDLVNLNQYLEQLYGSDCYYTLLHNLDTQGDQVKFGEWTLYSVYLLDYLKRNVTARNTHSGFLYQVHSHRNFASYRFDTKTVHFVGKDFDVNDIRQRIKQSGLALGNAI